MYKTFASIYSTTGSRVKTAKEINSILKIKDGGGLLWSKLSAEIPHSVCIKTFHKLQSGVSLYKRFCNDTS